MAGHESKPGYLFSTIENRCPRCRRGKLYVSGNPYKLKTTLKMHPRCPVCGQPTDIEVGFYYGTGYVSYGLAVGFSVFTFFAWWILIGFSVHDGDHRVFWWIGLNVVALILLQPVFMRLSRSLWLSWFVKYDPDWETNPISRESVERIVPGQMNNW